MPTDQDETLPQRYAREHQDYLKLCGSMTAEQVADIQLQLHNSLAREQSLQQRLTAADERADVLEGLVGEVLDAVGREPLDLDAVLRLRARMRASLKSAEGGGDDSAHDRAYRNGLMQGYNLAINGSEKEYQEAVSRYSGGKDAE